MLDTGLVLGMTATHLGVPLSDLVAWAVVIAFLAAPVPLHDIRHLSAQKQTIIEIGGAKLHSVAARCQSDPVAESRQPDAARAAVAVTPATVRLTPAAQWQAVSHLVSDGAERAMAVAREQQAIGRELDSLDLTLENVRRELASVMTSALPAVARAAPVALPIRRASFALAA